MTCAGQRIASAANARGPGRFQLALWVLAVLDVLVVAWMLSAGNGWSGPRRSSPPAGVT